MKKILSVLLILLNSYLAFSQEYEIIVEGYIGLGKETCGSSNGLQHIRLQYERGQDSYIFGTKDVRNYFIRQNYGAKGKFTENNKVKKVVFFTHSRRSGTNGCESEDTHLGSVDPPLDISKVKSYVNTYDNKVIYQKRIDGNVNIRIRPLVDIQLKSTREVCGTSGADIQATKGFSQKTKTYVWEFFDRFATREVNSDAYQALKDNLNAAEAKLRNCGSSLACKIQHAPAVQSAQKKLADFSGKKTKTEVYPDWEKIPNNAFTGKSIINLKLRDLYSSAADRAKVINKPIDIRINPQTSTPGEAISNVVTVQFLPELPKIQDIPITIGQCAPDNSIDIKILFKENLKAGQKIDLAIQKETSPGKFDKPFSSRNNISTLRKTGTTYTYQWTINNANRQSFTPGNYRLEITASEKINGKTVLGCTQVFKEFTIKAPPAPVEFSIKSTFLASCPDRRVVQDNGAVGRVLSSGEVTINAVGGTGEYEYKFDYHGWTKVDFPFTLPVVRFGHQIEVRDTNGCVGKLKGTNNTIFKFDIESPEIITYGTNDKLTAIPVSKKDKLDGSIQFKSISGADPIVSNDGFNFFNYKLYYENSKNTDIPDRTGKALLAGFEISDLPVGTHKITFFNKNNCESESFELPEIKSNSPLEFIVAKTKEPTCHNGDGVYAIQNIKGGDGNHNIQWIRIDDTGKEFNIPGGETIVASNEFSYKAKITDGRGVSLAKDAPAFNDPEEIIFTVDVDKPILCNGSDASIKINASGGNGVYEYGINEAGSYTWQSENEFSLPAKRTHYQFRVRDVNTKTCITEVKDLLISQPPLLEISLDDGKGPAVVHNTVFGEAKGEIHVKATGGVPREKKYFLWKDGVKVDDTEEIINSETYSFKNLSAGEYIVLVEDINKCAAFINEIGVPKPVVITQPEELSVGIFGVGAVRETFTLACKGDVTALVAVPEGGSLNYEPSSSYQWYKNGTLLKGENNQVIINATAGIYEVTVNDGATTSKKSAEFIVSEPAEKVSFTLESKEEKCHSTDGFLTINAKGGNGGYSYSIDGGETFVSMKDSHTSLLLPEKEYTVIVKDEKDCEAPAQKIKLSSPQDIKINLVKKVDLKIKGTSTGSIEVKASGGVGPFTYEWIKVGDDTFTKTTSKITNLTEGDYGVIILDKNECRKIQRFTINSPEKVVIKEIKVPEIKCFDSVVKLEAVVTGGVVAGDYQYEWFFKQNEDGPIEEIENDSKYLSIIKPGFYDVKVTDDNGAENSFSITVDYPETIVISKVNTTHVKCFGGATGTIDISVTGGTNDNITGKPAYTYLWKKIGDAKFSAKTKAIKGLSIGKYQVTVADANDCKITSNEIEITGPQKALDISTPIVVTNATGFGLSTGAIDLKVTGGTAPYTYTWEKEGDSTFEDPKTSKLLAIFAGTYKVVITDAEGCELPESVVVRQPEKLVVSINQLLDENNIFCFGDKTKQGLESTVKGGAAGDYSYEWTEASDAKKILYTTPDTPALVAGTYTLTVIDSNKNKATDTYKVEAPEKIKISYKKRDVLCKGEKTGSIDVTVTGGIIDKSGYTFLWTKGGETTEDLKKLPAGEYELIVSDKHCSTSIVVGITEPLEKLAIKEEKVTEVSGNGLKNGSIEVTVIGGAPAYSYSWENESGENLDDLSTTNKIEGLTAGSYSLTIKDSNKCSLVVSYEISEPKALVIGEIETEAIACFGDQGSLTVSEVTGGTGDYSYEWKDSSGEVISNEASTGKIEAGVYSIKVEDSKGNSKSKKNIELKAPEKLEIKNITTTDVSCYNGANGSIELEVVGGTGDYSYDWSVAAEQGNTISKLTAGIYTVIVSDGLSCSTSKVSIEITEPDVFAISDVDIKKSIGLNEANGNIKLKITGGLPPYNYTWTKLEKGEEITEKEELKSDEPTTDLSNVAAGVYKIVINDAKGCEVSDSYNLGALEIPIVEIKEKQSISCNGETNGSLEVIIKGGAGGNIVTWYNNLDKTKPIETNTEVITGLSAGTYFVKVINIEKVEVKSDPFTLKEPNLITAEIEAVEVTCFEGNNGALIVKATGGTADLFEYRYKKQEGTYGAWIAFETKNESTITDLVAAIYEVQVRNTNRCFYKTLDVVGVLSTEITQPSEKLAIAKETVEAVSGNGLKNGSIEVTVTGGTPAYSYSWENESGENLDDLSTTNKIEGLAAGSYNLTIKDSNECPLIVSYEISEPNALIIGEIETEAIACFGDQGSLTVSEVTGGTGDYSYEWIDSSGEVISNEASTGEIETGVYSIKVEDSKGNSKSKKNIELKAPEKLEIKNIKTTDISCYNGANGSIELEVVGGTGDYSYEWSVAAEQGNTISKLTAGIYTVIVSDGLSCSTSKVSIEITEPDVFAISDVDIKKSVGLNEANGNIQLKITGGLPPYTYRWLKLEKGKEITEKEELKSDEPTTELSNVAAGVYKIVINDAKGCEVSDSYNLGASEIPKVVIEEITPITCNGGENGSLRAVVTGGIGGNQYTWYNEIDPDTPIGNTTEILSNIKSGNYFVIVENAEGIKVVSDTFEVVAPAILDVTISDVTPVTCFGNTDGQISIEATGAITDRFEYRYRKSEGVFSNWISFSEASKSKLSNLASDLYEIEVRNTKGCFYKVIADELSVRVTEPTLLAIASEEVKGLTGFGKNNGSIEVAITGGTPAYSYSWENELGENLDALSTTNKIEGLAAGSYNLTIKDSNECSLVVSYTISEPGALVIGEIETEAIACYGDQGSLTVAEVTGGSGDYSYEWKNSSGEVISSEASTDEVGAGVYSIKVEDSKGNSISKGAIELKAPEKLEIKNIITTDVSCYNGTDGAIAIEVIGGTGNYTYEWNVLGEQSNTIEGLQAGEYTVSVTDTNLCATSLTTISIQQPTLFKIDKVVLNKSTDINETNGNIQIEIVGGIPPYDYMWTSTKEGVFKVEREELKSDNKITSLFNITTGIYTIEITDAKGCKLTDTYDLEKSNTPKVTIEEITPITCSGGNNASIKAEVIGGIGGNKYTWYNEIAPTMPIGNNTAFLNNIEAGKYFVVITNAEDIEVVSAIFEVAQPSAIKAEISQINPITCVGSNDGQITIKAVGAISDRFEYRYRKLGEAYSGWTFFESTNESSITGLKSGTYDIQVRNTNGCFYSDLDNNNLLQVKLLAPTPLAINLINKQSPSGFGLKNGNIEVAISGGKPAYVYKWVNNKGEEFVAQNELSNIGVGTYNLEITDANLCMINKEFLIEEPDEISVTIDVEKVILCHGEASGVIKAVIETGISQSPFTYEWINTATPSTIISTNSTVEGLEAGTYFVKVTDTLGNSIISNEIELIQPEALEATIKADYEFCGDGNDWNLGVDVSGGKSPYRYQWSNAQTTSGIEGVKAQYYSVKIIDANNCEINKEINLEVPLSLSILEEIKKPTCINACDASVNLIISNGNAPYIIEWSNGGITEEIQDVCAGTYTVNVIDANGCKVEKTIEISNPDIIDFDLGDDVTLCANQTKILDATIPEASIYKWIYEEEVVSNESSIEVNKTGIYSVEIITESGCQLNDQIFIEATTTEITAEFFVSTQVFTNEKFVIVNNSSTQIDALKWIIPENANIVYQDDNYAELSFEQAGEYQLGVDVELGLCKASQTKSIVVVDRTFVENEDEDGVENEKVNLFVDYTILPNPSVDKKFLVKVDLSKEAPINLKIFNAITNSIAAVREGAFEKSYEFQFDLENQSPGLYFVLLETSEGNRVMKLILN